MKNKYFICSYTAKSKQYCDEEIFGRIKEISQGIHPIHIVDNTSQDGLEYFNRLCNLMGHQENAKITHIDVKPTPNRTKFLRAVAESADFLRRDFLTTDADYFLIIESDVLVPLDVLAEFDRAIEGLKEENWGAIGGIYYHGFHDYAKVGMHSTHHCLSGCTVYNRKALEELSFRWSAENLHAFSDAWISGDLTKKGYSLWDCHDIRCPHLHSANGTRYSSAI